MTPLKNGDEEKTLPLFDDLGSLGEVEAGIRQIEFGGLRTPVWSAQKAKLIAMYLKSMGGFTKNGTYIDGFAGPHERGRPDAWTANRVLNNEPRWLSHFFLCELAPEKIELLKQLAAAHPESGKGQPKRDIKIVGGDFNRNIDLILSTDAINEHDAAFAVLDQRTFECHWETVRKLALHREEGDACGKVELFYFLAANWLHRTFSGLTLDTQRAARWWGRPDWWELKDLGQLEIAQRMKTRFSDELGYRHVHSWPIWERGSAGRSAMYYMIHATDHDAGPKLMWRAYRQAVAEMPRGEQLKLVY